MNTLRVYKDFIVSRNLVNYYTSTKTADLKVEDSYPLQAGIQNYRQLNSINMIEGKSVKGNNKIN